MNYDYLINLFKKEKFGSVPTRLSIEDIVRKYSLFPNEAIYLIDYKTAQIEPLTNNFNRVTGIDLPHKNEVTPLYEHVHRECATPFLRHIERLLKSSFTDPVYKFVEEQDFVLTLYKSLDNRVILKSTTILQHDTNDRIRYSVGKLMDVTGLIPYNGFSYKFVGPGSGTITKAFEGLDLFDSNLSTREIEVLRLVGLGLHSRQIAERMFVSRHTVDTHKRNIIRKMEADSSVEAYNKARALGLFSREI